MLKNYLKIAWRNLIRSRVYSIINIFGLAFGLAAVLLITLYVKDELSYDRFHKNADDIYRVAWWSENPQTRTPHPMAQALVRDFPEVVAGTSLSPLWGAGLTKRTFSVRNPENGNRYDEKNILSVDSTFFDVFSFELIKGNKDNVLRDFDGILISESTAFKYFGGEDPIGKPLNVNGDDNTLVVEGVFKDVPKNSHFHFDILVSYVRLKVEEDPESAYYTWADFGHFNYIRLREGTDPKHLQDQLMRWAVKYVQVSEADIERAIEAGVHFKLQRLTDIHLHSAIRWELEPNGNIEYVYIMTAAAFLILFIACVNFMNLSTARSAERSKEIGIRKSLGAFKNQISRQFLGESMLTALIALIIAGLVAEMAMPLFNAITDKSLVISYFSDPWIFIFLLGCGLLTGLIAGLYPALFMASIHPVISLKGIDKIRPRGTSFRKLLLVLQFVISMILVVGSLVIYNQLKLLQNKSLGFNKEAVMVIPVNNYKTLNRFEVLRTELLGINGVTNVSGASNVPGKQFNQNSIYLSDKPEGDISTSEVFVDYDFIRTLQIPVVLGRDFLQNNPADSSAFIINETAARQLGGGVVGKELTWAWDNNGRPPARGTVVGVVKDFHYKSLHEPVRPLLFCLSAYFNHIVIRLNTSDLKDKVAAIEKTWKQFEDDFGFEFSFLADDLNHQYASEQKTAEVFGGFSIIAVFIACFGLFGIASLSYTQRQKEVGIRKVMGASVSRILVLLIKDFTRLILVSIIVAVPIAWWIMDNWLHHFIYRTSIGFTDFVIAALVLVIIAWITVLYLTIKTARRNPVEILKEQ